MSAPAFIHSDRLHASAMISLPCRLVDALPHRWLRHARAHASRMAGIVMVLFVFAGSGCIHPIARQATPDSQAVVVVENHTDYAWRIAFDAMMGNEATKAPWQVMAPREVRRVKLTGGTYKVWRALGIRDTASAQDAEAMTLTFENGKTYAWPLGTLLSDERRDAP